MAVRGGPAGGRRAPPVSPAAGPPDRPAAGRVGTRPPGQPGPVSPEPAGTGSAGPDQLGPGQPGLGMPPRTGCSPPSAGSPPGARSAPVSALGTVVPRRGGPGPRLLGQRGRDPRAPGQDPAARRAVRHCRPASTGAAPSALPPSALAPGCRTPVRPGDHPCPHQDEQELIMDLDLMVAEADPARHADLPGPDSAEAARLYRQITAPAAAAPPDAPARPWRWPPDWWPRPPRRPWWLPNLPGSPEPGRTAGPGRRRPGPGAGACGRWPRSSTRRRSPRSWRGREPAARARPVPLRPGNRRQRTQQQARPGLRGWLP